MFLSTAQSAQNCIQYIKINIGKELLMKTMFWAGMIAGLFIGGFVGVAAMCLVSVKK